jgi:hypothetical protein
MQLSTRKKPSEIFFNQDLKAEKGFNFYDMLFMLKDKEFFLKVLEVLRERLIFDANVWSYSLYHKSDE